MPKMKFYFVMSTAIKYTLEKLQNYKRIETMAVQKILNEYEKLI